MNKIIKIAAVELVTKHGVKNEQIFNDIRQALVEASKGYPKIRVAYANDFGGYRFSDQFRAFLGQDDGDIVRNCRYGDDARVSIVPKFKEFGELMSSKHPQIYGTLCRHEYYSLGALCLLLWRSGSQPIDKLFESIDSIKEEDDLPWCKVKNISKEQIIDFVEFHKTFDQHKEFRGAKRFLRSFASEAERMEPNDLRLWLNQKQCEMAAIKYLIENPGKLLVPKDTIDYDCFEQMGLLFASDCFCSLRIHEVPKFVDWYIHEYDSGYEAVYFK